MKSLVPLLVSLLFISCSHLQQAPAPRDVASNNEPKLSDYSPYNYEVLFTKPLCKEYKYKSEVKSRSGKVLAAKPKNVFCSPSDEEASGARETSPQHRLVEWINDPSTTEVWFTYLTFSNKAIKEALCKGAKERGLKVGFSIDSKSDTKAANELVACNPSKITFKPRGNIKGLGLAHNKIFLFNPHSKNEIRIVFSSGNMTAGPVLHHENWHFITTNVASHFAQMHLCVMNAENDDQVSAGKHEYVTYLRDCRSKIETPEESDIKAFFSPAEGQNGAKSKGARKSAFDYILDGDGVHPGIHQAKEIWLACHRFLHNDLMTELGNRLKEGGANLRITADDDTFYDSNDPSFKHAGGTTKQEWQNIKNLLDLGAEAKFMETNIAMHQLHHSKYIIFDDKAVLAGAANFTQAAYKTNMENVYYITIPEVVQKFREYYQLQWNTMATSINDLPTRGNLGDVIEK